MAKTKDQVKTSAPAEKAADVAKDTTATQNAGAATATEATEATATDKKSIVPSKYAGKYAKGGNDALAEFINGQCNPDNKGVVFESFFELCRINGIPKEKVDHYQAQVAEKRHGAQGRARMTLRNMLANVARKNKGLKDLGGKDVEIDMPALPKPGTPKGAENAAAA